MKPPAGITAFRFKAVGGKATKKVKGAAEKAIPVKSSAPDPKMAALQKRLAQAQGKLEMAKAAGKATKNLEDKIYEIEDEIRLAGANG